MPDREKVIKGIQECDLNGGLIGNCPYKGILALLKEQEAVEHKTGHWIFESQYLEAWSHTCSECGKRMTTAVNTFANFCWNCGTKMEEQRQEGR